MRTLDYTSCVAGRLLRMAIIKKHQEFARTLRFKTNMQNALVSMSNGHLELEI